MLFHKFKAKVSCPCCLKPVPWEHRRHATTVLGNRKPFRCPGCGASLAWEGRAHNLLVFGVMAMAGVLLFSSSAAADWLGPSIVSALFLGAAAVVLVGYVRLHFVTVNGCNGQGSGRPQDRRPPVNG